MRLQARISMLGNHFNLTWLKTQQVNSNRQKNQHKAKVWAKDKVVHNSKCNNFSNRLNNCKERHLGARHSLCNKTRRQLNLHSSIIITSCLRRQRSNIWTAVEGQLQQVLMRQTQILNTIKHQLNTINNSNSNNSNIWKYWIVSSKTNGSWWRSEINQALTCLKKELTVRLLLNLAQLAASQVNSPHPSKCSNTKPSKQQVATLYRHQLEEIANIKQVYPPTWLQIWQRNKAQTYHNLMIATTQQEGSTQLIKALQLLRTSSRVRLARALQGPLLWKSNLVVRSNVKILSCERTGNRLFSQCRIRRQHPILAPVSKQLPLRHRQPLLASILQINSHKLIRIRRCLRVWVPVHLHWQSTALGNQALSTHPKWLLVSRFHSHIISLLQIIHLQQRVARRSIFHMWPHSVQMLLWTRVEPLNLKNQQRGSQKNRRTIKVQLRRCLSWVRPSAISARTSSWAPIIAARRLTLFSTLSTSMDIVRQTAVLRATWSGTV